ncbi:MAG: Plug domain-containing protein [Gammaproteobacteria bacterium]
MESTAGFSLRSFCCVRALALGFALPVALTLPLVTAGAEATGDDEHSLTAGQRDAARLDQVTVTTRRREERLLEVPDSVTALTAAVIDSSHITNVKDVALRIPNFSVVEAQQPGVSKLNVRGVCQANNGEPPVAVVVDGVQMSNAYQITQKLFDIEHIEVLKGPQGAVYGRAAWSVSAFLENALDEQYVLEFLPRQWSGVSAGDVAAAGRGRHWGVEGRYRF